MRNTFDIVDILYQVLQNNVGITSAINGEITKKRQINSDKEDVVIGSLPVTGEQIQQGIVNINIYVPNLTVKLNSIQDNSHPNHQRLKTLTALVIEAVDEKYYSDYWFFVQQQSLFESETGNEHYSNIRLEFYSENIKN